MATLSCLSKFEPGQFGSSSGNVIVPSADNPFPVWQIIAPDDLFEDSDTFFTAVLVNEQVLLPSLFTEGDTFYSPGITVNQILTPSLFTDGDTFYSPTVIIEQFLTPSLFTDGDTFYSPTVSTSEDDDTLGLLI